MKKAFNIAAHLTLGLLLAVSLDVCAKEAAEMRNVASIDPKGRVMTMGEISTARDIFGDSIDYTKVRLHKAPPLRDIAITRNTDIYFEFKTLQGNDLSSPAEGYSKKATLMHELTHVWQNQHRGGARGLLRSLRTIPTRLVYVLTGSARGYNYMGALRAGRKFAAMNEEQQGVMVSDYFSAQAALETPLCRNIGREEDKSVVCHGARLQRNSLLTAIRPALPLPGANK